jgi:hypothetical protein
LKRRCLDATITSTADLNNLTKRVRKVMTLNAWLDNCQCCSHTSDTSRDIHSYQMISASFNSIALKRLIWQRVVLVCVVVTRYESGRNEISSSVARSYTVLYIYFNYILNTIMILRIVTFNLNNNNFSLMQNSCDIIWSISYKCAKKFTSALKIAKS